MEKTRYDERQENQMLRIEKNGCSLAWYGLLAVILVQWVWFGSDVSRLAGEMIVFLALTAYLTFRGYFSGLQDRYWPRSLPAKLGISVLLGIGVALLNELAVRLHPARIWAGHGIMGLTLFFSVFLFSLLILLLSQRALSRRQQKLEAEEED